MTDEKKGFLIISLYALLIIFLVVIAAALAWASDVQQAVADIESVTPYVWEIVAVCGIFVSLTITQRIKKIRWLPGILCNRKLSKPQKGKTQYEYKQARGGLLDTLAVLQTFVYVSGSLYIRYETLTIMVIGFFAAILQWKIIKVIFHRAQEKDGKLALILNGDLYVPDDATVVVKTLAYCAGGGVDKHSNSVPDDDEHTRQLTEAERKAMGLEDITPTPKP